MISWVIIMLLFWKYQKLSQLKVKISYNILNDSPQIINVKVLFVAHICLIRSIDISTSWMISFLSSSNAFYFCTTKNYANLTRGQKISYQGVQISYDILTPPPTLIIITKFYLPFIFTWEDVLFYPNHINDLLCIYDAFIFCYQHMISQS